MRYNKIFWLEDHPDIVEGVINAGVSRESLFDRVTFAHDYEEGAKVVQKEEFDLYILDGDFPNKIEGEIRKTIESCLEEVKNDTWGWPNILRTDTHCRCNNFVRFYLEQLQDKHVIIFSISSCAPMPAYFLDTPFYSKGKWGATSIRSHVKNRLDDPHSKILFPGDYLFRDASSVPEWECGSGYDLIEKYLL